MPYTIQVREVETSNDETWEWFILDRDGWPVEGGREKGCVREAVNAAGVALLALHFA